MRTEKVEADVLCIGGGIAGLMAAIRAAELGARVVIAEKGNALYSGCGRAGNDHFWCYIPEVHGPDVQSFIKESMLTQLGPNNAAVGPRTVETLMARSFDIVKLWDEWGIPMKTDGKWEFAGHSFPGRALTHLQYHGHNQKKVLAAEAARRGAETMNRVSVFELLGSGDGVTGALGIDTREDRLVEFKAKAVILGTGRVKRMFLGTTPALMGNDHHPFTLTGDGRAMAYRLGAELVNMEMIGSHVGVRYFARSGQATWIGVYRDPQGRPLGPYVDKPNRKYGDILPEVDKKFLSRVFESGRGPVYMDGTGMSDEDLECMLHFLHHEGNDGLLNHLKEEGINPQKHPIEFMSYNISSAGMIRSNEKAETSIAGLYTAGDESASGINCAAVFGWIAGENAAGYSRQSATKDSDADRARAREKERLVDTLQSRSSGPDWKDANIALQQVMNDYAGLTRSQTMLEAGLSHLLRLREKVHGGLRAGNRWELCRCLEVLNLYDLAELLLLAALERRESRGLHQRTDYPLTDPLLNDRILVVKNVDGSPTLEWTEKGRELLANTGGSDAA